MKVKHWRNKHKCVWERCALHLYYLTWGWVDKSWERERECARTHVSL